nr:MAG TPA: hypothetical protein [Caudoviricetes sp.]
MTIIYIFICLLYKINKNILIMEISEIKLIKFNYLIL